jgi:hypothetical protein
VAVGIESQGIAKGLNGNDGAGERVFSRDDCLKKHFERIPGTAAEFGEEFSIIEKVSPEDLRDTEDEVAVGHGLEDLLTEPFPEFYNTLLVT